MARSVASSSNLAKPSFETKFHIDFEWWQRSAQELNLYLSEHLCEMHRASIVTDPLAEAIVDWVDPVTGQVTPRDRVTYLLLSHCSRQQDYITERTSMVDALFLVLLASGNRPMTPPELAERTGRSADTILKTLSGRTIYKGLRPLVEPK